jgi:hypothetical protein
MRIDENLAKVPVVAAASRSSPRKVPKIGHLARVDRFVKCPRSRSTALTPEGVQVPSGWIAQFVRNSGANVRSD